MELPKVLILEHEDVLHDLGEWVRILTELDATRRADAKAARERGGVFAEADIAWNNGVATGYASTAKHLTSILERASRSAKPSVVALERLAFLVHMENPQEWAELKAHVDGVCIREGCTDYVAAEDYWQPGNTGLVFELCDEHLGEVMLDLEAQRGTAVSA